MKKYPLHFKILLSITLSASPPSLASADVSELHPSRIIDGFEVAPCAWPSAVFLRDGLSICSGVYIGGRIVLTAAHCLGDSYRRRADCQVDADCPTADEFGNELTLECVPGDQSECSSAAHLAVSGDTPSVLFGERYTGTGDKHPRRTIPVQYCRKRQLGDKPTLDFAYCMLSEEPEVQAVPVMMHCEADQYLTKGSRVVAVAFGAESNQQTPDFGTKHVIFNELKFDGSALLGVSLSEWGGETPEANIAGGDSGSPLFMQLPDGTWRVIGLAEDSASNYQEIWRNVPWMLEDPNVALEQGKFLPCHTPAGEWQPTAACGEFPMSPDEPSGDWARGPFACTSENLSGPGAACGPPFNSLDSIASPVQTASPPIRASALDARPVNTGIFSLFAIVFGAGLWGVRRYRREYV